MIPQVEGHGNVNDAGILHIVHRKTFDEQIRARLAGYEVEVLVKKKVKRRSLAQNKYLFGCVYDMVMTRLKELGIECDKEMVHDMLKMKFLKDIKVIEETGEVVEFIRSTADLSTTEMMDYIAQIQQWSAETLDIIIPDPQQQTWIDYEADT